VYDLCESLIRDYRLDPATDPYLRFFLDAVLKVRLKTPAGNTEFLEWWENNRNTLSIVVPQELNAVRVMTIHRAKGLEFPLVILPFADESRKNTRTWLWVDIEPRIAPGLGQALLFSEQEMESTVYRELYHEEHRKSMVDMLNLLYVAMTRPVERLYVMTSIPPAGQEELKCLAAFFRYFLQQEGMWDENRMDYGFGRRSPHAGKQDGSVMEPLIMDTVVSSEWRNRIGIRRSAPVHWNPEDPVKSPKRGNLLHALLSRIVSAKEAGFIAEQACLEGLISAEDTPDVSEVLRSVVSHPALERLFSEEVRVRTEAEILLPDGSFFRPDRVVFDGDQVTIVDYKTGRPHPQHREQLESYAGSIREMGHRKITKLLVYLEPEIDVVEVM
jgi:ATP-dependent exoDNAse (exonuclease V) beta subunit